MVKLVKVYNNSWNKGFHLYRKNGEVFKMDNHEYLSGIGSPIKIVLDNPVLPEIYQELFKLMYERNKKGLETHVEYMGVNITHKFQKDRFKILKRLIKKRSKKKEDDKIETIENMVVLFLTCDPDSLSIKITKVENKTTVFKVRHWKKRSLESIYLPGSLRNFISELNGQRIHYFAHKKQSNEWVIGVLEQKEESNDDVSEAVL